MKHERDLVDRLDVLRGDDRLLLDVAVERDLRLDPRGQEAVRPAQEDVGLDPDRAQLLHRMLRGLGLELGGGLHEGHEREVDVEHVLAPDVLLELADGLEERQPLDVADRAADLDDHDVRAAGDARDGRLDLVGDVRNDLDRPAEVVAPALLLDDGEIDLPGRDVVIARHAPRREALVVAEIEVGLAAVVGDEDLAVLVGAHRARVDVDVGVQLLERDAEAPRLQERTDRRGREPLAEGRHDAAGHEDVFRRHLSLLSSSSLARRPLPWRDRAGARPGGRRAARRAGAPPRAPAGRRAPPGRRR